MRGNSPLPTGTLCVYSALGKGTTYKLVSTGPSFPSKVGATDRPDFSTLYYYPHRSQWRLPQTGKSARRPHNFPPPRAPTPTVARSALEPSAAATKPQAPVIVSSPTPTVKSKVHKVDKGTSDKGNSDKTKSHEQKATLEAGPQQKQPN